MIFKGLEGKQLLKNPAHSLEYLLRRNEYLRSYINFLKYLTVT